MLTIDDISWCSRLDYKNSAWWFNLTQRFGLVGDNRIWASESDVAPFTVPTELHFSGRSPKSLHEVTPLFSNANRLKRGLVCCEQKKKRIKTVVSPFALSICFFVSMQSQERYKNIWSCRRIPTSESCAIHLFLLRFSGQLFLQLFFVNKPHSWCLAPIPTVSASSPCTPCTLHFLPC